MTVERIVATVLVVRYSLPLEQFKSWFILNLEKRFVATARRTEVNNPAKIQGSIALGFLRQHFGGTFRQGVDIEILEMLYKQRVKGTAPEIASAISDVVDDAYNEMTRKGTVPPWVQEEIARLRRDATHG